MTNAEKLQILDAALDLTYKRLALLKAEDMDGVTAEKLLDTLSSLRCEYNSLIYDSQCNFCCEDESERTKSDTDDTETAASVPEAAPTQTETPVAEVPAAEPTKTLVEVRTVLSELVGRTGIDMPAVLAKFGATKLSEVDPAQYESLLAEAKKAAGEA